MSLDRDYIDNIRRAEEFILAARLCLNNRLNNAAATRAYYGVLHAGIAALVCFTKDKKARSLMDGKTHEKVAALYDQELVSRAKVFPSHKGVMHKLRERRHNADYKDSVNESAARKSVIAAEQLVDDIRKKMIDEKLYY